MKDSEEIVKMAINNLAEFICESDAIENLTDDPVLVTRQIKQGKKDGHVGAMLLLEQLVQSPLNAGGYLTQELICKVQGLITAEQHLKPGGPKLEPEFVGCYRPEGVGVSVGGRRCLNSILVPDAMTKLLDQTKLWQDGSRFYEWGYNLNFIADFHFHFLIIHPFADGNGRTSRAMAYYLMRWAGLKPFIFTSKDKYETYYRCFSNPEDSSLMREYFLKKFKASQ